jgi:hypothetical protein
MNVAALSSRLRAAAIRCAKLVPVLFRHDPLFRYATIAAVLALIFLAVSMLQDVGGRGALDSATTAPDRAPHDTAPPTGNSDRTEPPAPGSTGTPAAPEDAPAIAPGRSLDGIDVEPAPKDRFGTLPKGEPNP